MVPKPQSRFNSAALLGFAKLGVIPRTWSMTGWVKNTEATMQSNTEINTSSVPTVTVSAPVRKHDASAFLGASVGKVYNKA